MANTVTLLNYANTFGDWVVTTNALAAENNEIAANNYTKTGGTFTINSPGTGLQVANNAIIQGVLSVAGVGSSATIQNALTVQGQILATNTTGVGLVVSNTANIANVNITGSGTGLYVANNTLLGGTLRVTGATALTGALTSGGTANMASVVANSYITAPTSYAGQSYTNLLVANNSISAAYGDVVNSFYVSNLFANTAIQSPTLIVTDTANVRSLSANVAINTSTLYVSTIANVATLFANGAITGETGSFKDLTVAGNFIINGDTIYDSDTFNLKGGSPITGTDTAVFGVNRQSGLPDFTPNAAIQFSNATGEWSIRNITGADANTYSNIVTERYTANVTNAGIVQLSNNYTTSSSITQALSLAGARNLYNVAFSGIVGTIGTVSTTGSSITMSSNNGVVISGQGNTAYINTPQDVRNTATPTFAGLTLTAALPITQGGTGSTNAADARTAILPTGTTAGYVLTTGGPGTFYWSAPTGGEGSGATPGTSINSTRLSYTGDGTTVLYTAPSYVPGASQLRIYIDGVRQFASEYTETSEEEVTFGSAPPSGSKVLIEVDGYYVNPYYANNITFTAPFGDIISTANTIQLAIQDIETRKAALAGATFTGVVEAVTVDSNSSNTALATTAFVKNVLDSGNTFNINANTVTNGVYTDGSYSNPSWITSIANTKITGTFANTQITGTFAVGSITGLATSATTDTSNASNISTGTLAVARLGTTAAPQFGSLGVGTAASGTTGEIRATNDITAFYTSDISFKENVQTIENALSIVDAIGGKTFDWKDSYITAKGGEDGYFVRKNDFGVIAQDVESAFPLAVRKKQDGTLAVDYEKMCAIAFAAIKELKAEVDALKGK